MVKTFLPAIRREGRVINISSGGGSMTDPVGGWAPAYCASKSALNAMTRHWAHELSSHNISVVSVCPGWVQTDMGGKEAPRHVSKGAETPVWAALDLEPSATSAFYRDKEEIDW